MPHSRSSTGDTPAAGMADGQRRWVAIQRNRTSGRGANRDTIVKLIRRLKTHGVKSRLFANRERLQAFLEPPHSRDGLVAIVAAGGDGTVQDVVNRYPGVPIAVLPLGTENLLARYLKISASGVVLADLIAAGRKRQFDLGRIGDRRFTIMASIGFDADVIRRTHAQRAGNITKLNYIQPILQSLRNYDYVPMQIYVDGGPAPIEARLALIVNLPVYAMGLKIAESARGDDGRLDVRLFEGGSAITLVKYVSKIVLGTHERLADVRSFQASRLRIESERPIPIQVDGDPAGWTPSEICVEPQAVEFFVPEN